MFNVSALLLDDAFKPATPLTNGAINQMLRQFAALIRCLHDPANVQQTSSKCIQNTRELLDVCWTFAGSCKHPISDIICFSWLIM